MSTENVVLDTEFLKRYKVTYWDPCQEKCIGGGCSEGATVGCCPTIRTTPLNYVPTLSANAIRNEYVTGSDGNIYYIDKAGIALALEKKVILSNLVLGHEIGRVTNEAGQVYILNETVTSFGEFVLDGTVLRLPYSNEAGNLQMNEVDLASLVYYPEAITPITPVDSNSINLTISGPYDHTVQADIILDNVTNSGNNAASITANGLYVNPAALFNGQYTSNNGITTTGFNHSLGGAMTANTTISSLDTHWMLFDKLTKFRVENNISTNITTKFSIDTTDSNNNIWSATDIASSLESYIKLDVASHAKFANSNFGLGYESGVRMFQGVSNQLYSTSSTSTGYVGTGQTRVQMAVQSAGIDFGDSAAKVLGITNLKHYQRNMSTGYSGWVVNTTSGTGNVENNITRSLSGASLGTIEYPISHFTCTNETGLIAFKNTSGITCTLPTAIGNNNKILEIRAMGTAAVTLSPGPKLDTTGTQLTTLQPYTTSVFNSPTYVKLACDGTDWWVISQW